MNVKAEAEHTSGTGLTSPPTPGTGPVRASGFSSSSTDCSAADQSPPKPSNARTSSASGGTWPSRSSGAYSRPCTPKGRKGSALGRHPKPKAMWTQTPAGKAKLKAEAQRKEKIRLDRWKQKFARKVLLRAKRNMMQQFQRSVNAMSFDGKPIRRVSKVKSRLDREDAKLRTIWWQDPENQRCAVCGRPATERHHTRGRTRKVQNDPRWWAGLCGEDHARVKRDPKWAQATIIYRGTPREMPLLAGPGGWMNSKETK